MADRTLEHRRALVTGAASGIGRATARALARAGADLVLLDLDAGGLIQLAAELGSNGTKVETHVVDVGDREAMRACAERVQTASGALDVLVNNAGIGVSGPFLHTSLESWDRLIRVNLMGVVHGCHFFVPAMLASGRGGAVVNVSSAAGLCAFTNLAAYSATKFAVRGLSDSLAREFEPHGITVSAVFPGFIATAIGERSEHVGPDAAKIRGAAVDLLHRRGTPPERVAEAIVAAIRKRRRRVVVTPEAWTVLVGSRLAPDALMALFDRVTARMLRATKAAG